jgi:hypothetical protein
VGGPIVSVFAGSDASIARGAVGATTMKMISSTSRTSMSGVTLMSDLVMASAPA